MHLFSFTCCSLTQDTRYSNFTDMFILIKYLNIWVFLKYKAHWSAFFCWCWGKCVKMFTWCDLRREGEHFAAVSHLVYMVLIKCSRSSTEDEEEENGSTCSCSVPREGDAFPKAFERELVTPTNLTTPSEKQVHNTKLFLSWIFSLILCTELDIVCSE